MGSLASFSWWAKVTPWPDMADLLDPLVAAGDEFVLFLVGASETFWSDGTDVGGLDEVTTWSKEVEVPVSLLAVMARFVSLAVQGGNAGRDGQATKSGSVEIVAVLKTIWWHRR